jgi:glucose-6-phosphate dehydrogenase assembly protein OpcA
MAAILEPERILREMNQLWDQLDRDPSGTGVLRACAMTLIVVAEDDADAAQARRTIGSLMHDHPSRVLVVKTTDGAEMAARPFAECWVPFGGQQQICSEGLEVTVSPNHFGELARVLDPLRAPDLPVILWCRGSGPFRLRAFDDLFPLADKLVLDSASLSGASAALTFIRSLRARGHRVADLEWTRLTGWREVLSQLFDGEDMRSRNIAQTVTSVRIAYGGSTPPICALYFASWIGRAIPSAHLRFEGTAGQTGLRAITLSTPQGELLLALSGPNCLEVRGLDRHYRSSLPPWDEATLMREELKILGSDHIYEGVLG